MATTIEQQAFLVTADVPKIYMQEFWATAKLHQHSIHFKIDTRKSVLGLEAFREMLHISPRIPSHSFAELQFEEEILDFLRRGSTKPKASARKKKGDSASSTTLPTPTPTTIVMAALRLSATAKDEGSGSRPGVPDVPSDDSEEELSWNSFDDEDVDEKTKDDDEKELTKNDDEDTESGKGGDEVRKVKERATKKKQDKRKRKVLIQFPEPLKE
nr:hypothetical protein [Tanacetum cinerariifolium]